MHPNSINPKVIPYESTIPSYIRYLPAVPSKFVCAKSKASNEILFCMLEQLMYQLGLSVSSMLGGVFSRGVDSAPHSRENGRSPGCPVPCSNQIKIISNKTPPGLLLVGRYRCFGPAVECARSWWGSMNFTIYLGTAYNVCSMEDIEISWLLC